MVIEASVGLPRSSSPIKVIVLAAYTALPKVNILDMIMDRSTRNAILAIFLIVHSPFSIPYKLYFRQYVLTWINFTTGLLPK
jgi:hypothetical protein